MLQVRNSLLSRYLLFSFSPLNLGSSVAVGHICENSIPLSIFPIQIDKFVFCFCGLPGRGKTHISRRLASYLEFFQAIPVKVFNVEKYRLHLYGGLKDAEWFDPLNIEGMKKRNECNKHAIRDMAEFLATSTHAIAILDSTNPTHERRAYLLKKVSATVISSSVNCYFLRIFFFLFFLSTDAISWSKSSLYRSQ
jgi:hypothetical protein